MHLHFANLVDDRLTDVTLSNQELRLDDDVLWKPLCRFPEIEEDLLLYLAILGGKSYSGYYDYGVQKTFSTIRIFSDFLNGKGFCVGENLQAV